MKLITAKVFKNCFEKKSYYDPDYLCVITYFEEYENLGNTKFNFIIIFLSKLFKLEFKLYKNVYFSK